MERRRRTAKSQYLNRVITYMREHLQENLTLTQIAREAGLSESYLNALVLIYLINYLFLSKFLHVSSNLQQ